MSKKEKKEPHRIDRGLLHPAIALTTHMASCLYAGRAGSITGEEFKDLFQTAAANAIWSNHGINIRTAALMAATALHLQATLGSIRDLQIEASPSDTAAIETSIHTQRTMETVSALSALADHFGGGSPQS